MPKRNRFVHSNAEAGSLPSSDAEIAFAPVGQLSQWTRARQLTSEQLLSRADLLPVPSLRDEMLTISNFTGHPSLTLRGGFVQVSEARSDWAPDPGTPLPKFDPPRRVPHGVTLIRRLFDEGTLARAGLALERALDVVEERPPGF